jgi:4-hydroxy-2-oxoheptanedioate aldolase
MTRVISTNEKLEVPRHRLRNGLEEGKAVFGCFSSLSSSWTARIVASCGWDVSAVSIPFCIKTDRQYVIVDCEHGNHDDGDMHDVVNTIAAEGVSPIVRIRAGEYGLIKRALDCGAQCVSDSDGTCGLNAD